MVSREWVRDTDRKLAEQEERIDDLRTTVALLSNRISDCQSQTYQAFRRSCEDADQHRCWFATPAERYRQTYDINLDYAEKDAFGIIRRLQASLDAMGGAKTEDCWRFFQQLYRKDLCRLHELLDAVSYSEYPWGSVADEVRCKWCGPHSLWDSPAHLVWNDRNGFDGSTAAEACEALDRVERYLKDWFGRRPRERRQKKGCR